MSARFDEVSGIDLLTGGHIVESDDFCIYRVGLTIAKANAVERERHQGEASEALRLRNRLDVSGNPCQIKRSTIRDSRRKPVSNTR
jgi:hypothetical protein